MEFRTLPVNPVRVGAPAAKGFADLAALAAAPVLTGTGGPGVIAVDGMWGFSWEPVLAAIEGTLTRAGIAYDVVRTVDFLKPDGELTAQFQPWLTDNPVFGRVCQLPLSSYFDTERLTVRVQEARRQGAAVIVIGPYALGASKADAGLYCDVPREEIIRRQVQDGLLNLGGKAGQSAGARYKAAYYVEWPLLEAYKRVLVQAADSPITYYVDGSHPDQPVALDLPSLRALVADLSSRPFRCKPFFMPGVWGGQRLKEVADLPREWPNCAWDFEIVAPENGLTIEIGDAHLQIPFHLLMWLQAPQIMGDLVYRQFGEYFPLRVNYLDTMGGTNLSLQVHPHHSYMREQFGEPIGQDESYYIVERKPGAQVYLGLREDSSRERLREAVRRAEEEHQPFEITDHVNAWDANVGDLFLIPAGTLHCSGAENLVLEISTTPYWYTFKLYDYLRPDLEGKPRPINSGHGFAVADFTRKTEWVKQHLIPEPHLLRREEGGEEYHIGSTAMTFYSINRLHLTGVMTVQTDGGFLLLTVVAGDGVRLLAPESDQPLAEIAYLETYVVPAALGRFRLQTLGGQPCQVVKTYVRR